MQGSRKRDDNGENPVCTMVIINTQCSSTAVPELKAGWTYPASAAWPDSAQKSRARINGRLRSHLVSTHCSASRTHKPKRQHQMQGQSTGLLCTGDAQTLLLSGAHSKPMVAAVVTSSVTCSPHEKDPETQLSATKNGWGASPSWTGFLSAESTQSLCCMPDSNKKPTVLCGWHHSAQSNCQRQGNKADYLCSSFCLLKASPTPACLAVTEMKRGLARQAASWGCSYTPPPQEAWFTEFPRGRRQGDCCCCCQLCHCSHFQLSPCNLTASPSALAHPGSKHSTLLRLRWREKWMRLKSPGYHIPLKHWSWGIRQHTQISAHHPCLTPSKQWVLSRYLSYLQKSKPALPENFFQTELFARSETST